MINRERHQFNKWLQKWKNRTRRTQHTPLMTVLFAASTSLLLYQNCSVADQSTESNPKTPTYSSTIGGNTNGIGGNTPVSALPGGGAVPVGGGGSTMPGSTTPGGAPGGAVPVGGGGTTTPGGGTGTGGTGVNPGGSTGGSSSMTTLMWQYQPEDRTVEEGDVLNLGSYATKGIDVVTYQWYKNGQPLTGQTGYMYRAVMVPMSQAGTYYVVAKSGNDTIQSVSVTVKVKAARNPCAAGKYGIYPGSKNYNEYHHESFVGRTNTQVTVASELADGYTIKLPYLGFIGSCVQAVAQFQCRNGKLVSMDDITCTQFYDAP